jgi:membrane peptidoglycan carboxypeptidase
MPQPEGARHTQATSTSSTTRPSSSWVTGMNHVAPGATRSPWPSQQPQQVVAGLQRAPAVTVTGNSPTPPPSSSDHASATNSSA